MTVTVNAGAALGDENMGYRDPRHQLQERQTLGGREPGMSPVWVGAQPRREDQRCCSQALTTSLLN